MSEGQIMLRFMTRAMRRPLKRTKPGKPVRFPVTLDHDPNSNFAHAEHEEFEYARSVKWREAKAAARRVMQKGGFEKSLRLSCHPNSSLSASGMNAIIQSWERSGWGTPDVIVCDYADILDKPIGERDAREAINMTWKQLRAMSQSYHALMLTATQGDANSYDAETMTMGNFSEDKRKNAHVTGMVGINQTSREKAMGVQRLNWLALRESEFTADDVCHVAGCLSIANPAILSTF